MTEFEKRVIALLSCILFFVVMITVIMTMAAVTR